jgi:hypothetical protein
MVRHSIVALIAILLWAGSILAADKEVKCKLVKADAKNNVLTVITEDGRTAKYSLNEGTRFIGPKGGVSDEGVRDDRLVKGAELTLVIAGNNRTIREVRLPERKVKRQ